MDWQSFWDRRATKSNPAEQVGRIQEGSPLTLGEFKDIASHIVELLDLKESDDLLDLCCGNGWLSSLLATHCQTTVGIDLSQAQVRLAQDQHTSSTVRFYTGDVMELSSIGLIAGQQFDKINLYFSFQYMDSLSKGQICIEGMLDRLRPGGRILLGDVPDQDKLSAYFPTLLSKMRYQLRRMRGKDTMGKFWSMAELKEICHSLGAMVVQKEQPRHLPFSHYRSDYIISRI